MRDAALCRLSIWDLRFTIDDLAAPLSPALWPGGETGFQRWLQGRSGGVPLEAALCRFA